MKLLRAPRAFFSVLFTATLVTAAFIVSSDGAEAATRKSCKQYVNKAYHNCVSAKKTRLHRKQHTVFTRPQPASFIVDADSGRVLHTENADALRYPASLTKMMTLYLTFDALKKGKLKLDQELPVSMHAAGQPQTNIALDAGDRLAVKDAILSLVVRSANDSAVVLGEALGGSEEGFARKMTEKARALGMKNTTFYNASGLPDPRQKTTARDMAMLGMALRRDFPQYYPFFKTESFSYNGKTYGTHNRVMTRYDGVDGIKTGYIRASGFNLVTSAKKDGHTLVGVVLGGNTWRARDDKMIALLDQNFTRLAMKETPRSAQTIQVAKAEPDDMSPIPQFVDEASAEGQGDLNMETTANSAFAAISADPKSPLTLTAPASEKAKTPARQNSWGIQVGAYSRKSDAVNAATRAMKTASRSLASSKIAIADRSKGNAFYRARLVNISQDEAENACKTLSSKKMKCFAYETN